MKGWLTFWAALIAIALTAGWFDDNAPRGTQWFLWIAMPLLIVGVFVARASHKRRVEAFVHMLVDHHQSGKEVGLFGEWFDANTTKHSNRYRISEAARIVMRVYGGRHVINEIVSEGYQNILYDDLLEVFGDGRAEQVLFEVLSLASRPGFLAGTLLPVGLGAYIGYKATTRR